MEVQSMSISYSLFIERMMHYDFEGSKAISDQLYFGGDVDAALDAIETGQLNKRNSRFFLGYSGWSKGQLEEEINMESWAIQSSSSSSSFLEANTKELWRNALINMGVIIGFGQIPLRIQTTIKAVPSNVLKINPKVVWKHNHQKLFCDIDLCW